MEAIRAEGILRSFERISQDGHNIACRFIDRLRWTGTVLPAGVDLDKKVPAICAALRLVVRNAGMVESVRNVLTGPELGGIRATSALTIVARREMLATIEELCLQNGIVWTNEHAEDWASVADLVVEAVFGYVPDFGLRAA
ncbi:MAG: hypothetical protein RBS39_08750 [Phycisphaerales bacterium]|jgi:hypothetical protein|nr:hypothetical protein [Phycisphaerales bacterium]